MLFCFGVLGLAYVHYVLPRFNRSLGFPAWHEGKWVRRWNYGLLAPFLAFHQDRASQPIDAIEEPAGEHITDAGHGQEAGHSATTSPADPLPIR